MTSKCNLFKCPWQNFCNFLVRFYINALGSDVKSEQVFLVAIFFHQILVGSQTVSRGKLGIVVLLHVTGSTLHVAVIFSLNKLWQRNNWDFPVIDEYRPYNISLLFCLVVNAFPVIHNNPSIPSFPLDVVFDQTRSEIRILKQLKHGAGKSVWDFFFFCFSHQNLM